MIYEGKTIKKTWQTKASISYKLLLSIEISTSAIGGVFFN